MLLHDWPPHEWYVGNRKWKWQYKRVWNPFIKCDRSDRSLFLKKAYHGRCYTEWEVEYDMWLSKEEYLFQALRGDPFDE